MSLLYAFLNQGSPSQKYTFNFVCRHWPIIAIIPVVS
jgi:hypothetical protein